MPPPALPESTPADHRRALLTLLACTVLWSTAGVGTRHLEQAEGFEIAFWRSVFCAAWITGVLTLGPGGKGLSAVRAMGRVGVVSGALWAAMFTCFMVALSMTTVANVLVVMAASPLLAAVLGWAVMREPVPPRTVFAIFAAGAGIVWMVRDGLDRSGWLGMAVAFAVPVASSINIVLLKRSGVKVDLAPSVLVGATLSALVCLPLAWPLSAGSLDLAILALLGVLQLAVPCMLMVRVARHLAPHEVALIGLMEAVLGPLWAWLGAGEVPNRSTLQGGAVVLTALLLNELMAIRKRAAAR